MHVTEALAQKQRAVQTTGWYTLYMKPGKNKRMLLFTWQSFGRVLTSSTHVTLLIPENMGSLTTISSTTLYVCKYVTWNSHYCAQLGL